MRHRLSKLVNAPLKEIGLSLVSTRAGAHHSMPTWKARLQAARDRGFFPNVILDGGAFTGLWSSEVAQIFPGAQIILVEPNPYVQESIRKNISRIQPAPRVINAALGALPGKAMLNFWLDKEADTGASLLAHVRGSARNTIEVDVDTIDNISLRTTLVPDLVKLDLQGAELAALRGASSTLNHAELMVVEFGCLDAYIGRTSPRDLLELMYANGYCLYDIVDCHYRPYDGALTGGDFFFVKQDSALRKHKGWE